MKIFHLPLLLLRAGVQTRVRGEGAGAGQELAQSSVRGDEISLRFPPTSLYLQVINGLTSDPLRGRGEVGGEIEQI